MTMKKTDDEEEEDDDNDDDDDDDDPSNTTTLNQHWFNVDSTSWRWINILMHLNL